MFRDVARRAINPARGSSTRSIPIQNHANSDVLLTVVWAIWYARIMAATPASSQATKAAAKR
jgi:hypothetical protein